jgi:hypothetical protein
MKRAMIALGIGAAVFATVYGFADSLNVTSASLGAGSSAVAACQTGAVNMIYTPTYQSGLPGYEATTVTVNGLDLTSGHCGGKAIRVTLTGPGASNASLGEQTATLPTSGVTTTQAFTFSGVKAADVTGVHVVVSG